MLCPSAELFLDCGQRLSLFVLYWLTCLLVSSCQLPGNFVQACEVSLCCSFFCLSCQVVGVASLICSYASFRLSVSFIVLILSCYLCFPSSIVIQGWLPVFSYPDLLIVARVIHSLCCTVFLPTTPSQELVHICSACSHFASGSVLLSTYCS